MKLSLFDWPSRHNVPLALPAMLVVSFLLHAACVLAFSVVPPREQPEPEQHASIQYLRPATEEAERLAPLLEAMDPALFSAGRFFEDAFARLPQMGYVAGFDKPAQPLEPLPESPIESFQPLARRAEPLSVGDRPPPPPPPSSGLPTAVRWSGELADRACQPPQDFRFSPMPREGLAAADFMVGVSAEGLPMHFFLERSSGSEALDRDALRYLAGCRFAPDGNETSWGRAEFLWGAESSAPSEE